MTARLLVASDRAAMRIFYNANRAAIATVWPGGASAITASEATEQFTRPGAVNVGSFDGVALQGVVASNDWPDPEGKASRIWLWFADPSLTNSAFRDCLAEMMLLWFTEMDSRGYVIGYGFNPMTYPGRFEALFQKMVTAGFEMTVQGNYRVVRMRIKNGLAAMTRLAAL